MEATTAGPHPQNRELVCTEPIMLGLQRGVLSSNPSSAIKLTGCCAPNTQPNHHTGLL